MVSKESDQGNADTQGGSGLRDNAETFGNSKFQDRRSLGLRIKRLVKEKGYRFSPPCLFDVILHLSNMRTMDENDPAWSIAEEFRLRMKNQHVSLDEIFGELFDKLLHANLPAKKRVNKYQGKSK